MAWTRRDFLIRTSATGVIAHLPQFSAQVEAPVVAPQLPRWIWYPGQLAAYRHARRVHLAVERCTKIGYPANFRQPLTQAYFRKLGVAKQDTPLRWFGPVSRLGVSFGGSVKDITVRSGLLRSGQTGVEVHLDFSATLPCFLLDGGEFSTGEGWQASLDGQLWVPAEVGSDDPKQLPDAPREVTKSLPVVQVVEPEGKPQRAYSLLPGRGLLVDFRETELGALRFTARGSGQLTIQVGESIAEVKDPDPAFFEQFAIAPIELTAQSTSFALPQRALRFARIVADGSSEISDLQFDASVWPAEEKGTFACSDDDLNAIWTTAVATMKSNMHDFYLDGIRRDGLLWHDGPLSLEAYERVFFDADLSRQTLIGETMVQHPSVRDIGILDSPMYDVIGFAREYKVRGDAEFSRMFRDRIEDILQFFAGKQDSRGFVDAHAVQPYGFFPDWSATKQSGPDLHGAPAYGQILLAGMFTAGAQLAEAWGDGALSARYASVSRRVRASVRETFLQPQEGLYSNGLDAAGQSDSRFTSFAQAFAIVFGVAEPDQYDKLFRFLDDDKRRPAHFSLSQVIELEAYAKAGRADTAVKRLKSAWLPMIQQGYHRFFEDIVPAESPAAQLAMYGRRYGASLCHAWAGAAPVMAISRGVLGVNALTPGYKTVSIAPQRCGLAWARGTVPTPHGLITVEWHGTKAEVTLPAGVTAQLSDGRSITRASAAGKLQLEIKP